MKAVVLFVDGMLSTPLSCQESQHAVVLSQLNDKYEREHVAREALEEQVRVSAR